MSAKKARAERPAGRSAARNNKITVVMKAVGSQTPAEMHRELDRRLDQRFAMTRARQHRELDVLLGAGLTVQRSE